MMTLATNCVRDASAPPPVPAEPTTLPTPAPPPSPAPRADVGFAPISYFQQQCASCHGDHAAELDPASLRGRDEDSLADVVRDMTEGMGGAPLEGRDLEILVAFHRAYRDGESFVAVESATASSVQGDVRPGSSVVALVGGDEVPASVESHRFTLASDRALASPLRLRVTWNGRSIERDVPLGP
jgi:mono/diheme cytochrome c family protein